MSDRRPRHDPPALWWFLIALSGGGHLLLLLLLPSTAVQIAMPTGTLTPDWIPVTLYDTPVPTAPQLAPIPTEPAAQAPANAPNPAASPAPNPAAAPSPNPAPSPSPSPNPAATPTPSPSPSPNPSSTSTATPRPSPQPSPSPALPPPPGTNGGAGSGGGASGESEATEFVAIVANPTLPSFTNAYGETVQRDIPDQLATVRRAEQTLAIAQYLAPLGLTLTEPLVMDVVVIIDATGQAEVLPNKTTVLAGSLTPSQAGNLAAKIIETWEFNPTLDQGQPKAFDYTIRLTLRPLA